MLTLLHGDNIVASRKVLTDLVSQAKAGGLVVRIDGKTLSFAELGDILGAQDLFCEKKTIVIEGLLSQPKSKKKDELIEAVTKSDQDIILWEGKPATPAQLKKFMKARVQAFKTSASVFVWLDNLRPGNELKAQALFQKAVEQDGAEMCFAMLQRQVRLLLQLREGVPVKLAPFAIGKLQNQARLFTTPQLLKLHEKMVKLDYASKMSQNASDMTSNLTLLLMKLAAN